MRAARLSEMLGFPAEAKLLIVNADDFGMCHAENLATIEGLEGAAYDCATVMMPCPWLPEAAAWIRTHPEADIGVHLTHTSEWSSYRWRPILGGTMVPSLVDEQGYLFATLHKVYERARLDEIERESRAQIEAALAAGIDVSHLDSHMGTMQVDPQYHLAYLRLAGEYRLPIRMVERALLLESGMQAVVEEADRAGILAPDHFHHSGPRTPQSAPEYWSRILHRLEPGVTEIYVHPAAPDPELQTLGGNWAQRPADHAFFSSSEARDLIEHLGIVRIGYRTIRDLQRSL